MPLISMKHLVTSLIILLCTSMAGCTYLFFHPTKGHVLTPAQLDLAYEDVFFKNGEGLMLHAWLLRAKGKAKGTVYFLHGNAENVSTHIGSVYWMPQQGFNVFLMDYRGYGKSDGESDIDGIIRDAEAGLAALVARKDIDTDNIIVFGQSMGGAVAVYTVANSAYRDNIRALVIDSAFADYHSIAQDVLSRFWLTWPLQWPLSFLVDNSYAPLKYIDKINPIPLLVIHGRRDRVVPYYHSELLYAAARERKQFWVLPNSGHINGTRENGLREHLVDYFENVLEIK